jgi:phosphoglycerol transferase MdoB-like AlkP superfamily enzyme
MRFHLLRPLLQFATATLLLLTVARIGLTIWQLERVSDAGGIATLLVNGLRMDIILVCQVLVLPAFCLLLLPGVVLASSAFSRLWTVWLATFFSFIAFMEAVTPPYAAFFDARPGRIFFEYLDRPVEVMGLVSGAYLVEGVLALTLMVVGFVFTLVWFKPMPPTLDWSLARRFSITIPLILVLALGARSSTGHRPANPSTVAVTGDQLVNELALSSSYKLLYAVYSMKHESKPGDFYPAMSRDDVLATVKASTFRDPVRYLDAGTTHHTVGQPGGSTPKNIVIVVEESLGARFVSKLGGLPLTPRLDQLAEEGIWFTNLFATGIRSARGLEAIVAGFPPSPARSVLKLGKSQSNFFTMAHLLKSAGYQSHFMYGGESHFDNMRGFFMNNGFDHTFDINDFDTWDFKATWGVSDEDLFNKAHETLSAIDTSFFAVIFSSSFHSPFEFPDGRIELYEEPKQTKHNAVKYADHALGGFIDKAKDSNYWHNTVFLIVADHDERARGASLVPVSSFHIPGVILGDGISPRVFNKVVSQVDLMPTVIGLAGVTGIAPYIGEDIRTWPEDYPGRAIMQFGNNHALMIGDEVVIHRPDLAASQYRFKDKELTPMPLDQDFAKRALATALLPGLLYSEQLYTPMLGDMGSE